ncbi:hypothetical protein GBAR_LOCUS27774, partial [Geodia barretti]
SGDGSRSAGFSSGVPHTHPAVVSPGKQTLTLSRKTHDPCLEIMGSPSLENSGRCPSSLPTADNAH